MARAGALGARVPDSLAVLHLRRRPMVLGVRPGRVAWGTHRRCTVTHKPLFLHERLLAYQFTRQFYRTARAISKQLPRGLADLGDQLTRAARTSCLALAEGANARSIRIKRCHFERALASDGECAAALDQVLDDEAAPPALVAQGRDQLEAATRLTLGLLR